jgi:hypothetical protein
MTIATALGSYHMDNTRDHKEERCGYPAQGMPLAPREYGDVDEGLRHECIEHVTLHHEEHGNEPREV